MQGDLRSSGLPPVETSGRRVPDMRASEGRTMPPSKVKLEGVFSIPGIESRAGSAIVARLLITMNPSAEGAP